MKAHIVLTFLAMLGVAYGLGRAFRAGRHEGWSDGWAIGRRVGWVTANYRPLEY